MNNTTREALKEPLPFLSFFWTRSSKEFGFLLLRCNKIWNAASHKWLLFYPYSTQVWHSVIAERGRVRTCSTILLSCGQQWHHINSHGTRIQVNGNSCFKNISWCLLHELEQHHIICVIMYSNMSCTIEDALTLLIFFSIFWMSSYLIFHIDNGVFSWWFKQYGSTNAIPGITAIKH